jgi:hypothetical protein
MGGEIGLTVRLPDGTEHRMERWTNILPSLIYAPRFWNGDADVWKDALKHWETEAAKKGRGKTIISSWEMYKHPYLAPSEYGILVVDYKTMTIVSAQGYMSIVALMPMEQGFKELKAAGLIGKQIKLRGVSFKGPMQLYKIKRGRWKVHAFRENNLRRAKRLIEGLGFALSPQEEKIWAKKMRRR